MEAIAGAILAVVGAASCFVALRFYRLDRRFKQSLVATVGRVVAINEVDSDGQTMYVPTVEYVVAGEAHHVTDGVSYGKVRWQVGDAHDVRYDPGEPGKALLHDTTGERSAAELFGWMGGALVVAGVGLLVSSL